MEESPKIIDRTVVLPQNPTSTSEATKSILPVDICIKAIEYAYKDLEQIYFQHRAAESAGQNMLKICLAILSFPLVSIATLLSTGIFGDNNIASYSLDFFIQLPKILAILVLATAFLNLIPLFNMIENHQVEIFCKRAINDLRKIYLEFFSKHPLCLYSENWKPDTDVLKNDSNHPKSYRFLSSINITVFFISLINSSYFACGFTSLDSGGWLKFFISLVIVWVLQYWFLYRGYIFLEGKK